MLEQLLKTYSYELSNIIQIRHLFAISKSIPENFWMQQARVFVSRERLFGHRPACSIRDLLTALVIVEIFMTIIDEPVTKVGRFPGVSFL